MELDFYLYTFLLFVIPIEILILYTIIVVPIMAITDFEINKFKWFLISYTIFNIVEFLFFQEGVRCLIILLSQN
jgi:hypothetical protein